MLSIEEAAKSLQRTYLAAGFATISGNKDTIKAAFAAHEDAIRAGFLAVLEEAMTDNCSFCADCYIDGNFWEWNKKSDHNCNPASFRARIENLGKEAKS